MDHQKFVDETAKWVEHVVIKHNFCPFAHKPVKHKLIRYQVCMAKNEENIMHKLIDELILLRDTDCKHVETSIVIAPNALACFEDYNQFLGLVDTLLQQFNLQGTLQVAGFHPKYQFIDLGADDVRNYTNRSPYPMFHLIREESVEKARNSHIDTETIPEKNMSLLLELGLARIKNQLDSCYQHTNKKPNS